MARPAHRRRPLLLGSVFPPVFLLLAISAVVAACGGSSASSDPGSANYDPAKTTLKDAGLEVCSEVQRQNVQTLESEPGVTAARSFDVAKNCNGAKNTPNAITAIQFDSREAMDAGKQKIESKFPNASTYETGPLIIVATGPDRKANLAAVKGALPPSTSTTG